MSPAPASAAAATGAQQSLDDDILLAMNARPGGTMTYVIANILGRERGYRGIETAQVLRRLKRMERSGRVERVRTGYAVQLCWRRINLPPATDISGERP